MTNNDPGFGTRLRKVLLLVGGVLVLIVVLKQREDPSPSAPPVELVFDGKASPPLEPDPPVNTAPALIVAKEPEGPVAAPISLTASDGTGLELVSLSANAVVEDPLAFTELRLVFRNPESRVREGRFRITLPAGATISRFAMRIGDRLQEGEVVEQQAARVAYEDFLHRRQDPALLEAEAGNEFSARVFPIPANATKELIVSYSQELTRKDEPYVLPLRGLPKLGQLSIRALVQKTSAGAATASSLGGKRAQHEVVEVERSAFMPDRDFAVAHSGDASRLGLRHENLVAARIVPIPDTKQATASDPIASLFVLVDTSASRALGLSEQLLALERLLTTLAKSADPTVTLAAFDQDVTTFYSGKLSARGDSLMKGVAARRALGASDLDAALRWLEPLLAKQRAARVLLVSDGVATAGETSADKLRARVKALGARGVERLDVLAVGGIRDDVLLQRLVTSGLARDGMVLDATRPADLLARKLTRATRSNVKLEIDGAGWVWPSVLHGVQPGDELMVYADLPPEKPLAIKVDGVPAALSGTLASAARPLLERAWIKARIHRLLEQRDGVAESDRDLADALKTQVIELSTKHRVLSPFTSLLVLETEWDYARFNIERRALADILTIDASGIALVHRSDVQPIASQVVARPREASDAIAERRLERAQSASIERTVEEEAMKLAPRSAAPQAPATTGSLGALRARMGGEGSGGAAAMSARGSASRAQDRADDIAATAYTPLSGLAAKMEEAVAASPAAEEPVAPSGRAADARMAPRRAAVAAESAPAPRRNAAAKGGAALQGELHGVLALVRSGDKQGALKRALAWRDRDAGDVLALVALGESWEALSDHGAAARAYGSIIDLFPGRADMRRFAGERLERVKTAAALALAVDTYGKAVEQRPDHPASHRLFAFALLKQGRAREAFTAMTAGARRSYPSGRFRGVDRILREDLGLLAAAWIKAEPALAAAIQQRLGAVGGHVEDAPSLRFVLNWETDANDVDFHIYDGDGGHAYYSAQELPSGGELYEDVTTGYGPECFTIRKPKSQRSFPYKLQAHYYSRGPMGYGMGKLQVIEHDGHGGLRFEERPFIVMQDGAYVDLGTVRGS